VPFECTRDHKVEESVKQHLISDILYGPAQAMAGSGLADAEAIKACAEEFAGLRYCIVRQWLLLDVILPAAVERAFTVKGLGTTVLFAQRVVYDSTACLAQDTPLLSGLHKRFDDCFFECEQGLFVLAGKGARKRISLPALIALEEAMGDVAVCGSLKGYVTAQGVQMYSQG